MRPKGELFQASGIWKGRDFTSWSIELFRERLSEKMCRRQSRKVIRDMINTLFLTLQQSNLLLLLSFSTRKHMSMASRAILSNFFEEQWTQNHPQYLSGLSRAPFPTTFLEIAVWKRREICHFGLYTKRPKRALRCTLWLWKQSEVKLDKWHNI